MHFFKDIKRLFSKKFSRHNGAIYEFEEGCFNGAQGNMPLQGYRFVVPQISRIMVFMYLQNSFKLGFRVLEMHYFNYSDVERLTKSH